MWTRPMWQWHVMSRQTLYQRCVLQNVRTTLMINKTKLKDINWRKKILRKNIHTWTICDKHADPGRALIWTRPIWQPFIKTELADWQTISHTLIVFYYPLQWNPYWPQLLAVWIDVCLERTILKTSGPWRWWRKWCSKVHWRKTSKYKLWINLFNI